MGHGVAMADANWQSNSESRPEPIADPSDAAIEPLDWQVAAASVCGTSHQRYELPCQDAHAWEILPSGAIAIAVADGAGSAVHSDRGSQVAVAAAIGQLRDRASDLLAMVAAEDAPLEGNSDDEPNGDLNGDPDGDPDASGAESNAIARDIFDGVLAVLTETAASERWELPELATTLVAIVADRAGVVAIQIGDGAAIVSDRAGRAVTMTAPDNGEYANETVFVTSKDARDRLQVATWRGEPLHLAAMTDGLQRLALTFPDAEPHLPFFRPLFQFVAQVADPEVACAKLADFLASPRVSDRADDDLTLLLAGCRDPRD